MTILADAEKRERALDTSSSFHLEAPAGSGKTSLLTARFLKLLGMVDHPRQVLALTFTNKAAGEMRERVCRFLNLAAKDAAAENEVDTELLGFAGKALCAHQQIKELLLSGEILRIQTFHSFCYSVVAQAPLEAGIAPGSTLMDDNEQQFFLRETVDSALREIAGRGSGDPARRALQNRLLYLNNSWRHLADEMEDLLRRREGMIDLVRELGFERSEGRLSMRVRGLVENALKSLAVDFATCSLARGWARFLDEISAAGAQAACSLPTEIPPPKWESIGEWVCLADALLTKGGGVKQQLGPKAGFYSGFAKTCWGEALQEIPCTTAQKLHAVRSLPSIDSPVGDPDTLWDLVLLFHAVLDVFDTRCRGRRVLDYAALEMAALRLFDASQPSDLQLILDQQIRHMLVDEFQDTSRGQWDLLKKLCAGWTRGDGRTLLLVGDPKQSIYAFRKAEVRLFMEAALGLTLEDGEKVALEPLVLETNFRSVPHLIGWCNSLFGQTVMVGHDPDFDEVPFSPAVPRSDLQEGWKASVANNSVPVGNSPEQTLQPDDIAQSYVGQAFQPAAQAPELALFLEWPDRDSARLREARWLAGKVAESVRKNGPSSEIGILLFSRTHLPIYLEALQSFKIPVQVKEGLKLLDRPEVRALRTLCRAMVLPHDDLAWVAQLRSPWLFINLDRMLAISAEEPEPWVEKIRSFSKKDEEVKSFWEALGMAWRSIGHEPLWRVVESAWLELGGAEITGKKWGSRGLNCCRRFLDMLRQAEQGEPVGTLTRLEQLLESTYEPVDPDTALSNVFLMTVHGAKGLEFDTVFIPFMDWDPAAGKKGQPPPYMLERSPGSGDYLLAPRPDRLMGEEDPLYSLLRRLQSRRKLGESKRLFYVAATRARSELVMSALVKKSGTGFSAGKDTPLGWLNAHNCLDETAGLGDMKVPDGDQCLESEAVDQWRRTVTTQDGLFSVLVEPSSPEIVETFRDSHPVDIRPASFQREKPAFKVVSPSSLVDFAPAAVAQSESTIGQAGTIAAPCPAALRGTLIHRLLAEFGKAPMGATGNPFVAGLPSLERISSFLRHEGVDDLTAQAVAREAAAEVQKCIADPWLARFYAVSPEDLRIEYAIESAHARDTLFSGIIDLAANVEGKWNLLDFKTSRPAEGEPIQDFCRREMNLYRPQLIAYREMWAKLKGIKEEAVEVFIYWTALRDAEKIDLV